MTGFHTVRIKISLLKINCYHFSAAHVLVARVVPGNIGAARCIVHVDLFFLCFFFHEEKDSSDTIFAIFFFFASSAKILTKHLYVTYFFYIIIFNVSCQQVEHGVRYEVQGVKKIS